jgi:hypothetical protein
VRAALATAVVALVAAAPAAAKPQGVWHAITSGGQSGTSQIGLERVDLGARGKILNVAWTRRSGPTSYDLLATRISADGAIVGTKPIVTGWVGLNDAALEGIFLQHGTTSGDLAVFFTGQRSTDTSDPHIGLLWAESPGQGTSWSAPRPLFRDSFVHGRTPSVAWVDMVGTYLGTWYDVGSTVVLRADVVGGSTGRLFGFFPGGSTLCCSYQQNVAASQGRQGSRAVVAWCSGINAPSGLWVQGVDPATGAPAGAPLLLPGSSPRVCDAAGRVPLVSTGGPNAGFYAAEAVGSPSATTVRLWRVGGGSMTVAAGTGEKRTVALASVFPRRAFSLTGGDGRVWVGWSRRGSDRLFFRRSNRRGTVLGALVSVRQPRGQVEVSELDLDAQEDRVDVLARYSAISGVTLFHTQVYPGLTLRATGGDVATFRVTDAGEPVAGATVRVAGRTLRTNAAGVASTDLPRGSFRATASKALYNGASARVRGR